jgi:hypothetical protein
MRTRAKRTVLTQSIAGVPLRIIGALLILVALQIVLCRGLASVAQAGVNFWTSNGPPGTNIISLVVDPTAPTTLFAGTTDGVFKSTDGGTSWNGNSTGLRGSGAVLAIDPVTPHILYAGTDVGVFKSTNGGTSWMLASQFTSLFVSGLVIDPRMPTTLYAGGDDVFKSVDWGAHWSAAGLTHAGVYYLAIDPGASNIVYATTSSTGAGVYKSTDGGANWSSRNSGLPVIPFENGPIITALVIDPLTPTTLYVGTVTAESSAVVFKSTDGGMSWSPGNTGLPDHLSAVWALAIDPITPGTLYAGTSSGVFKSLNGGACWNPLNGGLPQTATGLDPVAALAIAPGVPSTLYAGTSGHGIFAIQQVSTCIGACTAHNGMNVWTGNGPAGADIGSLAVDPTTPSTLYAGAIGSGVFKSIDGSASWNPTNTGLTNANVTTVAIDPLTPRTLYAGTAGSLEPGDVFKSTDGAASWSATGLLAVVNAVAVDPHMSTTLYAAAASAVFKSTDGGTSWSTSLLAGEFGFTALAVDPRTPTRLYAGATRTYSSPGGLFESTDAGASWTANPRRFYYVFALAIDPGASTTLYAVTDTGVLKSTDAGKSWSASNVGLAGSSVQALVLDPVTPSTLYAGTRSCFPADCSGFTGGVFKSTDAGTCWNPVSTGLPNAPVNALAIDPLTPTTLYAGTQGSGVFAIQQASASVTINEIMTMVNIALGNALVSACVAGDGNHDGAITVDEILAALNNALNGCPAS